MSQLLKEKSLKKFEFNGQTYHYYKIATLQEDGYDIVHLPYSIRILLEGALRQCDGRVITEQHICDLANWTKINGNEAEVPFKPSRVILQDFTGVPALVDLASMREAMLKVGADEDNSAQIDKNRMLHKINPEVPVDLVIDHSVQVDSFGCAYSLTENMKMEFDRNMERYHFLRWAKEVFDNVNIVPPATGIVHQVNLEYLAQVVSWKIEEDKKVVFPDTLVGTDSHTTMINGLGVLGWGRWRN